jgi:hypothetical protein
MGPIEPPEAVLRAGPGEPDKNFPGVNSNARELVPNAVGGVEAD